jgi:dienelactone hydrolase
MFRTFSVFVLMLLAANVAKADPVTLTAADGVKVYGQYWPAPQKNAPLILAFHQAGSSHAEYAPLAPRLNRLGFSVLAIDQRSGGGEFGGQNRTVRALGRSGPYDAALADLDAALAWGRSRADGSPVLAWGSSYSAALVFLLAAKNPEQLQGLLAFSPGEYLDHPDAVVEAASSVRVPVFIDQAKDSDEVSASRSIFNALPNADKTLFVAQVSGVHGSATLREDRNPRGAQENWVAVERFLSRFLAHP